MTYQAIINYANVVFDDYHMPFMDQDREAQLLYDAIVEFTSQTYREGERTERRRQELINYIIPLVIAGGTKLINLNAITEFLYTFELGGVFTDPCDSTKTMIRPIKPMKLDKHFRTLIDSFEKPDDYFPQYIEYTDSTKTIEVVCDTNPVSYKMYYVKQPHQPTTTEITNGDSPEFGDNKIACFEVAKILARKTMPPTEDLNRYPVEQNEIALQH